MTKTPRLPCPPESAVVAPGQLARIADPPAGRPPRLGVALIAAAACLVELAVSGRYGYVRDELYFRAAGQHLAFGYVDQPPLTPLLARISAATGDTLAGLRVLPALALAALVLLTASMSRLLAPGGPVSFSLRSARRPARSIWARCTN